MNIFHLDSRADKCAQYMYNKHVVKMVLEYTQILCTVLRLRGYDGPVLYKPTHIAHPCVRWALASKRNYRHLLQLAIHVDDEYSRRYNRRHKCHHIINTLTYNPALAIYEPEEVEGDQLSWIPLYMPPEIRTITKKIDYNDKICYLEEPLEILRVRDLSEAVQFYRKYYVRDKFHLMAYKGTSPPPFILHKARLEYLQHAETIYSEEIIAANFIVRKKNGTSK